MKHYLVVLSAIICTGVAAATNRIYGGQNATSGQFPFMAALNYYENQFCNGVIIAPSWILTVAYCISYVSPIVEVYIGSNINQVNGTGYTLFERIIHEEYNETTTKNDIALIRINTTLEYSDTIQQVELGVNPSPNSTCTILGWGVTESVQYPPLQYVDTTAIDLDLCLNLSVVSVDGFYLGPEQICTISDAGQGACNYDYGGALICDGKLSGLYSYNIWYACGTEMPDVYTSIETYSDWILSHIQA